MNERTNGSFDGITGLRSRQDGTDGRGRERPSTKASLKERGADDDDDGKQWLCLNYEECDSWFGIGGFDRLKIARSYRSRKAVHLTKLY